MWHGYLEVGGNEIVNAQRVETYASILPYFKPTFHNTSLAAMLGDADYTTPFHDDAPWTDPDIPDSYNFYGLYPLDMTGFEDSTREATVTENTGDNGHTGKIRHGTRSVVVSGVLFGADEAAVAYGMEWLKKALLANNCGSDCDGIDLCFLSSEPQYDPSGMMATIVDGTTVAALDLDGGTASVSGGTTYDGGGASDDGVVTTDYDGGDALGPIGTTPTQLVLTSVSPIDCLSPLRRTLRSVNCISGPAVTGKSKLSDGSYMWTVTFTIVSDFAWTYGDEVEVIEGFMDPKVTIPWVGGVVPEGGYIDFDGHIHLEADCAVPEPLPLQDPLCPALVPPPLPPSVPLGCYTAPKNWRRRQITIPNTYIPLWGDVVPYLEIHARDTDVRNLRLRFYADVDGDGDITDDPCSYCGDIVFSYIPQGSTLVFDATSEQVYVYDASQIRRPANSVVFATDGTPFDWPILSCGFGYIVTVDLPQTQHPPVFDLSLYSRAS